MSNCPCILDIFLWYIPYHHLHLIFWDCQNHDQMFKCKKWLFTYNSHLSIWHGASFFTIFILSLTARLWLYIVDIGKWCASEWITQCLFASSNCLCVVCVHIYIYIYIYTHTHIYIYLFIYEMNITHPSWVYKKEATWLVYVENDNFYSIYYPAQWLFLPYLLSVLVPSAKRFTDVSSYNGIIWGYKRIKHEFWIVTHQDYFKLGIMSIWVSFCTTVILSWTEVIHCLHHGFFFFYYTPYLFEYESYHSLFWHHVCLHLYHNWQLMSYRYVCVCHVL